mgnify:CR=1 FL=1
MINFYKCNHCGNIVMFLESSGVIPVCCGDEMTLMKCGVSDGAAEKHVPVISTNGDRVIVTVGETAHPMTGDHHIDWIVLETNKGMHLTYLSLMSGTADAGFTLQKGEKVIAAYEHCNLHGLWMREA